MFRLNHNLSILGSPGSGKGFYGRLLAQHWKVPLVTTSDILKKHAERHSSKSLDLESGKLADCQLVAGVLLDYLREQQQSNSTRPLHCILDGFPRTTLQIQIMQETWPVEYQIHGGLHLNVPDEVCREKSLGRRFCTICQDFVNTANVQMGDWDLPPTYPKLCSKACNPETDWVQRKDDVLAIIQARLAIHHEHEEPILDYFRRNNALYQYTPYKGVRDFDRLRLCAEEWLQALKVKPDAMMLSLEG
ncbi:hypothetical protein FisN_5Hh119 [Fistulifera solaris]|uniref:Adenylate kinase n=1 Tax=Fistulifera solaris TaxID=1519565 RepID=A0A1Z5JUL4_FISSO|nr:hypothetical protein FisN_5Hh119 [Fistulifera solaris]|eukprot:GAX17468.1 hypothetical protein FisN_5Hh119 [Fistulifera solaris]